jgi:(S)-3,5-dihydroxyphenylglycine transaminase
MSMIELRGGMRAPLLDVMNFLNNVQRDYPQAISFAPGRPNERFFQVESSLAAIERYVDHRAATLGIARDTVVSDLGQYQLTRGMINDLLAQQLANDEAISVTPESIVVTHGAQEAMLILMLGLFDPATDVLLSSDPTYVGITGPATMLGVEIVPVPTGDGGIEPEYVERLLREVRGRGKVPKALYDIPDFNNPLGTTLPLARRHELLELARANDLLLFEDNPYGMFDYEGDRQPTLKSLDETRAVIYIGSFAKTVFPGLRLGTLVADQSCAPDGHPLAEELSKIKSLTTVTTSPLPQAVLGGILLENDCSLEGYVRPRVAFYRQNRDSMVERLDYEFGRRGLAGAVTWNRPRGGFFMTVTLPFEFDAACLEACAANYGVVVCPMSFFSLSPGRERQIRLSFSYVDREQIERGIGRLADFVSERA